MVIAAKAPRRVTRTPHRPVRAHVSIEAATEPPNKKRKFLPGGPGGGGRYFDNEGNEFSREAALAAGLIQPETTPRIRSRRDHTMTGLKTVAEADVTASQRRPVRVRRERPERYVPPPSTPRPRYSNAAAAAAASQMSDGYKPREERSWEDFHPDLEIDAELPLFTADEVDGRTAHMDDGLPQFALTKPDPEGASDERLDRTNGIGESSTVTLPTDSQASLPVKRRPGRPPRRPESMLSGLGSPPAPRIVPLPTHNPKERLNLPKPSFRKYNHFLQYEESQKENKDNYVDRTMAHYGYQETDQFVLPSKVLIRLSEAQQGEDDAEVGLRLESDGPLEPGNVTTPIVGRVEYDMDEQDVAWLEEMNEQRKKEGVDAIKPAIFEITMTQIEKEYHALEKRIPKPQPRHAQTHRPRSSSQAAVNGDPNPLGDEPDSKCSICDDGDCENTNAIIFCDGCDLAVHQECYGVPFIPEGQWFCRKCKEIGRGTPTCIFCPNVDGAFKQTNTLRWSHLLCAIWIPEVTIANMTFMEPIQDVDKVPKSRWKLGCYICNQKMGACIQCGNKNCYQAFHVTCARRAKLFLKMKSQQQGGIDTSALKAFCDKHVPQEWRRMQDTDSAIVEAKRWYRHNMKDRKWADSQTTAIELGALPQPDGGPVGDATTLGDTIAVQKRRRTNNNSSGSTAASVGQSQASGWRLANSGAPVVPAVVYATVEAGLVRFTIRKRKEFVEKACKYWTLKREARRGAALLKRLQLQLESFSTMEITRRDFAAMGAVGGPRLERRIAFAEMLQRDIGHLTQLCTQVKLREELRLKELENLRELVDTVYFPMTPLLRPILDRAQKLDDKSQVFAAGFELLSQRLHERYYTSVSDFSRDLSHVFNQVLGGFDSTEAPTDGDIEAIHSKLNEIPSRTAEHNALSHEQKELKKLAKRIVKAVKEPLEAATRKEAQLRAREMEEEIRRLDSMPIFASAAQALEPDLEDEDLMPANHRSDSNGSAGTGDVAMPDAEETDADALDFPISTSKNTPPASKSGSAASHFDHETTNNGSNDARSKSKPNSPAAPLSPPISRSSVAPLGSAPLHLHASSAMELTLHQQHPSPPTSAPAHDVFAQGGVPWYLTPFDPVGTTIHEEQYMGRAVLRDMSEELSDMDEDTLTELAPPPDLDAEGIHGVSVTNGDTGNFATASSSTAVSVAQKPASKTPHRRRVGRRAQWSRPRR